MKYRTMNAHDWSVMQFAPSEQVAKIQRTAKGLAAKLSDYFNGKKPGGVDGLSFELGTDAEVVASVTTPVGIARLRLVYSSNAETINAEMRLERRTRMPNDTYIWQPVYGLFVKGDGTWEFLGGGKHDIFKPEDVIFGVGCAILFATINGPTPD